MDDDAPRAAPSGDAVAWTILAYLISGPLVYGGIGWLLDRWLGSAFLTPVGIVVGMALALYLVAFRYRTR